jgi:hypothetical protein
MKTTAKTTRNTRGFIAMGVAALCLSAQPAVANESSFFGSYKESIAISIPPHHGVEPKLSLEYDSSGGNGLVGVGWSLQGWDTIQRFQPGMGLPRYDGSDIFALDGQPLVQCLPGSLSPSCRAGGTHSTKIESFLKIAFDATIAPRRRYRNPSLGRFLGDECRGPVSELCMGARYRRHLVP